MIERYLLDTNAWGLYLKKRNQGIVSRVAEVGPERLLLCSVVKAELIYGAYKSGHEAKNLALLDRLFAGIESLPFNDRAATVYGQIRARLEIAGMPMGPHDFQIAAIALEQDLTVVTHNTREFVRVPGLRIEDWQTP